MKKEMLKVMNRRVFFKSGLRFLALGSLGFLGLNLGFRKGITAGTLCGSCSKIDKCKFVRNQRESKNKNKARNCSKHAGGEIGE